MKAFKAYDIRGVYQKDWNSEDAYRIGFFIPRLLEAREVLVGRDVRISSDEIFKAVSQGIRDAGADVVDLGLCTTPMVYWATARFKFLASVQITASHNPKEYNGLKVSGREACPIGYENGLQQIETWIATEPIIPAIQKGVERSLSVETEYLAFLKSYLPDLKGLQIAVDASNGMAGLLIEKLFGKQVQYINLDPDGNFPNHDPNPLELENVKQLAEFVQQKQCDLGIIFDGDADRVMFVDEKGSFISPDLILAVLGEHFLDGTKTPVLQDIRTSRSVAEYLTPKGAEMFTWKVGRAFAAPELKRIQGLLGGELAGHYYFRDFYYSDSGILAALIVCKVFADKRMEGLTVSEYMQQISRYHSSGELNFVVENKTQAIQELVQYFTGQEDPLKRMDFDGVRLDYEEYWLNIRPSNTEPYLRFIAEAVNPAKLEELIRATHQILEKYA